MASDQRINPNVMQGPFRPMVKGVFLFCGKVCYEARRFLMNQTISAMAIKAVMIQPYVLR